MKIKRGRKKRRRIRERGGPWSTISINHLESSALTLAGTLKASRVSARTASFLKEAREGERERESFNWRREVREGGTKATRATFSTYKK